MSCSTMMKVQTRPSSAIVRPRSRASVSVKAARQQAPAVDLRSHAVAAIAAAALLMSPPSPALAAERTPNNTPLSYSDLPKDGPKVNDPGQLQPGDGIGTPRSDAKAQQDAAGLSVGRAPAGQPRRISALPSAPRLYEVADLGDAVKSAIGFGRELGDTDNAGSNGTAQRLQESAKDNLKAGADQAVDSAKGVVNEARRQISTLPSAPRLYEVADVGDAVKNTIGFGRELGDIYTAGSDGVGERLQDKAKDNLKAGADKAVDTAKDAFDQARRKISALPSTPRLYEVADLGDAVKSAIGFGRELGDTDSAGSGDGPKLGQSAQANLAGGAQQAADKVQGLQSDLKSQAADAASSVKGAVERQLQ